MNTNSSTVHYGITIRGGGLGGNWRLAAYCGDNDREAFIELDDITDVTCRACLDAMVSDGIEWCNACGEELNEDGDCDHGCTVDWASTVR